MSIQSELISLEQIVSMDYSFAVPIYQRLYVWEDDQVRTLLDDLWTAFETQKPIYYLGSTLVLQTEEREGAKTFDLIDGQQRFTTLWLMSLAWKRALEPFLCRRHQKHGRVARITFPIRPEVNEFFASRIVGSDADLVGNPRIVDAMALLDAFKAERISSANWQSFTEFVYNNVQMVLTQVPVRTDLNKLFELINNRGVQLQHHEILKAKLLGRIPATERNPYAQLWDACAEMGNYVEKTLRDISKVKITELYTKEENGEGVENLAIAGRVLEEIVKIQAWNESEMTRSLAEILAGDQINQGDEIESDDDEEDESGEVRSIISFPMLLEHTLRIWLHREKRPDLPKILDKELLDLFSEHFISSNLTPGQVTGFIELLWEIRYCFDKYIIKWVTVDKEEQHLICPLYRTSNTSKRKTYYTLQRRTPMSSDGFSLLQSMLYHSQQITTHYWLTPLLAYLHENQGAEVQAFDYLQHLDNHLLCSTDARPLIERTHDFLVNPWKRNPLDCSLLSQPLGVAFPHYWFYKLEFLLWNDSLLEMSEQQRSSFRITAKNSVEHISPQHAQSVDTNTVSEETLNTFGNLALVSRSINSEYSNKPFNEKREQFLNRNRDRIDSLKMAIIYRHGTWNDTLAKQHQDEMIALIASSLTQDDTG